MTRSKRGKAIYSPLHRFVNKEMNKSENDENETEEVKKIKEEIVKGNLVKDAAVKKKHKPTHNGQFLMYQSKLSCQLAISLFALIAF